MGWKVADFTLKLWRPVSTIKTKSKPDHRFQSKVWKNQNYF